MKTVKLKLLAMGFGLTAALTVTALAMLKAVEHELSARVRPL